MRSVNQDRSNVESIFDKSNVIKQLSIVFYVCVCAMCGLCFLCGVGIAVFCYCVKNAVGVFQLSTAFTTQSYMLMK